MDKHKCYTSNGGHDLELTYVQMYDIFPSRFEFEVDSDESRIDVNKTNIDDIKSMFKQIDLLKIYSYSQLQEDEDDDSYYEEEILEVGDVKISLGNGGNIAIIGDKIGLIIRYNIIVVLYDPDLYKIADIRIFAGEVYAKCIKRVKKDLSAKVSLINVSQGEYYTQTSKINRTDLDIDKYYNDDFKSVFEDIKEFLNDSGSGLIMLSGKIGTGKTSLIRYLCSEFPHEYIIVPNSIAARLGDPELISFITEHQNSVFILEDCEQLLQDRSSNMFNDAINTILNMSDGLLSDIVNVKLICTFNADVTTIDPALLRKGRCFARYEFGDLCEEKVKVLNDEFNLNLPEIKPMTLAEIFNSDSTDYTEKEQKMGF